MQRIVGLLLAAAVAGCSSGGGDDPLGDIQKFGTHSLFDPVRADPTLAGPIVPFPFDGLFSGFSDPTLNIPNATNIPFVTAANLTDGFSTTASIFTDLTGFVDYATAAGAVVLINSATGQRLQPGLDYLVQTSTAIDASPPQVPLNQKRSRLLIEPLRPLAPSTTYLVGITTALRSTDGLRAGASDLFKVTRSDTPVSQQSAPVLDVLNPTQLATLEVLRAQLIRPAVEGIGLLAGVPEEDLVLAWSFTTQSTTKTLQALNDAAVARPIGVVATGFNTQQVNPALPPVADIYAGTVTVPYYLANSGGSIYSTAPLTSFWAADATQPDLGATFLGLVPCGAFAVGAPLGGGLFGAPSVSTTACFPVPVKQSDATIPLLVTVPNGLSGQSMPEDGWPVVVFQHGITGNRSQMLALAPALAAAGFVTVAIDLPLHGISATDSAALLRIAGLERTFDLDLVANATGAPGPDGSADPSGTHFINLSSLLTSRDNLRQAAADVINLVKSVNGIDLDDDELTDDIDESRVYFVGHSLGGIVGTAVLGVNSDISAATLAMAGGGIARLLDASKSFGPRIAAGLAASGVVEGTDSYESFLRFAQHIVDSGDPMNYAAAAAAGHPLHVIEVIDDLVVPNSTPAGAASATLDRVTVAGYLSGTDPLIQALGATVIGPIDVPLAGPTLHVDLTRAADYAVRFNDGDHGSILSPAASLDATVEMQRQTANFLASDGICLPVGGSCS
jgi:pimeloyl-ACP methyl ester carboxylesterase